VDSNEIRNLFDYMYWAHERMMRPVLDMPSEEFLRELGSSHSSLRDTLVHIMSVEWIWLSRWHGISPPALLDPTGFLDLESVEKRWASLRHELQRFLGQIRDEDLSVAINYRSVRGEDLSLPLVCTLQHLVNHHTYHRGQVATLLRLLGREPVSTDMTLFFFEDEGRIARAAPRLETAPAIFGHDDDDEEEED
jgi:uncharacterized damage-inducible protein DinB